jgi:glutamate 5-kinase
VRSIIAAAHRPGVLSDAVGGQPVGTVISPHERRLTARKLWIAFAVGSSGQVAVDEGAREAVQRRGKSLLAAGVTGATGSFGADEAVEVIGPDGTVFAKGLTRMSGDTVRAVAGRRTDELPDGVPRFVIHRDDLVVLP